MKKLPLVLLSLLAGPVVGCGGDTAQGVVKKYISAANNQQPVGEYQCVLIDNASPDILGESFSIGTPVDTDKVGQYTVPVTIVRDGNEFAVRATVMDTEGFVDRRKKEAAEHNQNAKETYELIAATGGEIEEKYWPIPSRDDFSAYDFCVTIIR